jgi:hypothetical protein
MTTHFCQRGGLLTGDKQDLPDEPAAYAFGFARAHVGCNHVRCSACGERVRSLAGVKGPDALRPHLKALAATEDWLTLPGFSPSDGTRLYACSCHAWAEDSSHWLDDPDNDDLFPVPLPAWRCAGHPTATLPMTIDGERIDGETDWLALVARVADGWAPPAARPLEAEQPISWLIKLYAWLLDTPTANALSRAIADVGATEREGAAGQAIAFFRRFPRAAGFEIVLRCAEASGIDTPWAYRHADRYHHASPRDALVARREQMDNTLDDLDERVLRCLADAEKEDDAPPAETQTTPGRGTPGDDTTSLDDFSMPTPLGDGRFWSAELESVNPGTDEAYWWVTLTSADGTSVAFFVMVYFFGPLHTDADRARVRAQISRVAATGATNTTYSSSMMWRMRRRAQGRFLPDP